MIKTTSLPAVKCDGAAVNKKKTEKWQQEKEQTQKARQKEKEKPKE